MHDDMNEKRPEITGGDGQVEVKCQGTNEGTNKGENEIDVTKRKLTHAEEMERIREDSLAEAKEIEGMSDEILIEKFEYLIRSGAGPDYRRIVFMRKELLRRINKGYNL